RSIYWEAKGETLEGQLAVAEVILNRVEDRRFGENVCAVVTAPGQFSFVRGGEIPAPRNRAAYATARAIALIAMEEHWSPVVGEATHFHARYVNPGWRLKRVAQVGNHIFYR
ncbi:MAG: cell wall hydrolase, partial [Sphingomonadaceae bacterium]